MSPEQSVRKARPSALMRKNFSYFLAKRYLIPKGTFVIIINAISIVGVCLGVAIMIVVLSVMKGFENEFQRVLLGSEPHLVATNHNPEPPDPANPEWITVGSKLEELPNVIAQSPFVIGQVIVRFGRRSQVPLLTALQEDSYQLKELAAKKMLKEGDLDLAGREGEDGVFYETAIVSRSLAESFRARDAPGLQIGDVISIISPAGMDEVLAKIEEYDRLVEEEKQERMEALLDEIEGIALPKDVLITGIIDTPMYQQMVIPSLETGQELFDLEEFDEVHGLALYTKDPYKVAELKEVVRSTIPFTWDAFTWVDKNQARLNAIRMERSLISTLLFFIIIVAAFCIMNTIIVTTVQKRREIGVMKALGARANQIVKVFLYQGFIVGTIGTTAGIFLGLLILHFLEEIRRLLGKFGSDPFPEDIYGLSKLPVEIIPTSIIVIAISAVVTCTIAAIPPAWAVARLDAARALRAD